MRRLCTRMAKKFVRPPLPFTLGGAFNNLSFGRDIHTIQNLVHLCHHRVVSQIVTAAGPLPHWDMLHNANRMVPHCEWQGCHHRTF